MTAGLLWAAFLLVAMGWFAIGWVARGQENRRYGESRLRHLANVALDAHVDSYRYEAEQAPVAPAAIAPVVQPVVHVHLGAVVPAPAPLPRVIDAREIES